MTAKVLLTLAMISSVFASTPALAGEDGGVAGAIIGGLIGNGLGHGRHRGESTVIGAVAGAVIGSSIENDQRRANNDTYNAVYSFAASRSGLALPSYEASEIAQQWLQQGCGDRYEVSRVRSTFQQSFRYAVHAYYGDAYSARAYAIGAVRNSTRCGYLFR